MAFLQGLIARLGRVTHINLPYAVSGGFWLTAGQVVASLSVFLLGIAFANLLPPETYGTYKYLLSIAGLFAVFTLPGMDTALTRDAARGFDGSIRLALFARMRFGVIGALGAVLLAGYYAFTAEFALMGGMLVIALFLPVFDAVSIYGPYQYGKQRFRESTWCYAFVQVASVAVLIATAFLTHDVLILVFAYFASYTLFRFVCLQFVLQKIPKDAPVSPETVPYGKHMTAIGIATQVAAQADKILLFHMVGAAEVAIYTVATALTEQARAFLNAADTLLFPKFATYSKATIVRGMLVKSLALLLLSALAALVYILIAPWLFALVFPQYVGAVFLSQIFALSLLAVTFAPAGVYLRSHSRIKEMYWGNLIAAVFQITSMLVLTWMYGLLGLIIARIASRFFSGILALLLMFLPSSKEASYRM